MEALIGGVILLVVIVVAVVVGAVSAIVAAAKDTLKDERSIDFEGGRYGSGWRCFYWKW